MTSLPDTRTLVRSLGSTLCPGCGKPKNSGHTFCARDYFSLTPTTKRNLYRTVGDGYEAAVSEALAELGITLAYWPETTP